MKEQFTLPEMFDYAKDKAKVIALKSGYHAPLLFTGSVRNGRLAGHTALFTLHSIARGNKTDIYEAAASIMRDVGGDFMLTIITATSRVIKMSALTDEEVERFKSNQPGALTDEIRAKAESVQDVIVLFMFSDEYTRWASAPLDEGPPVTVGEFVDLDAKGNVGGAWEDLWREHKTRLIRFDYTAPGAEAQLASMFDVEPLNPENEEGTGD